jgi:hypothetical protein
VSTTTPTPPALEPLEAQIIEFARKNDMLAEVCHFVDYDPDVGRVPEHWRVRYQVMAIARALARPDPYREHLAKQAEGIEQERLQRCLTLMGSASAGAGQEGFAACLAENVNRLTRAVDSHLASSFVQRMATVALDASRDPVQPQPAAVPLSSMPELQAAVAAGLADGSLVPQGAQAMNPWKPDDNELQARRIGKSLEELGELVGVLARISIQGMDAIDPASGKTNRVRMAEETADVMAQIECNIVAFGMDRQVLHLRELRKRRQMAEWEALLTGAQA